MDTLESGGRAAMSLEEALKIVRENDYIVIKFTESMKKACDNCGDSPEECLDCPCNICVVTGD
ncbi:conserved hypothetical protein [Clostridium neonatale]|nr:conserved hypothetical protein [Clostridium neonatale]